MNYSQNLPEEVTLPDYNDSILNLSCSILQHYGIKPNHNTLREADALLSKNFPHVVVILLDGLGMNILERHLHPKDFLRRHLITDYSSVFPPTTTASTTSFLSGKSPIEHGWLGWDVYFEQEDKIVTCFHNTLKNTKEQAAEYDIPRRYLPYENIIEQINKAGTAKAFGIFPFGPEAHTDLTDWCHAVEKTCKSEERTFTYAYWEDPDSTLHIKGTTSSDVEIVVKELNAKLANLCSQCKDTIFLITADHGHIDVRNEYLTEKYPDMEKMLIRETSIEPRAISFYVKPEHKMEFAREFNDKYYYDYLLFTKEEALKMELFGPGVPNENLTGIGDYIAAAFKNRTLYWKKTEKDFKSHHAGLSRQEMKIPLIGVVNKNRHTGIKIWYALCVSLVILLFMAII